MKPARLLAAAVTGLMMASPAIAAPGDCMGDHFLVEIGTTDRGFLYVDGIGADAAGVATRVSGAQVSTRVTVKPGNTVQGTLTLGRYLIAGDTELFDWWENTSERRPEKRDGIISLLNADHEPCAVFKFADMTPTAYRLLPISANDDTPPIEEIEVTFTTFRRTD